MHNQRQTQAKAEELKHSRTAIRTKTTQSHLMCSLRGSTTLACQVATSCGPLRTAPCGWQWGGQITCAGQKGFTIPDYG
eukprot:6211741-Pleurochrysis_carterae.AAC.8